MEIKFKLLTLGLMMVFLNSNLKAQQDPETIIKDFFNNYESKGSAIAIDELYATNPWTVRIQDAINNVKTQLARFNEELVGKYHGYEKLTNKNIGESYALYSYFIKFDRQLLRFTFQFYKPSNEWRLASFQFDDNFDEEIEEAARVYYMDLPEKKK